MVAVGRAGLLMIVVVVIVVVMMIVLMLVVVVVLRWVIALVSAKVEVVAAMTAGVVIELWERC